MFWDTASGVAILMSLMALVACYILARRPMQLDLTDRAPAGVGPSLPTRFS